jgi:hypothetical protein
MDWRFGSSGRYASRKPRVQTLISATDNKNERKENRKNRMGYHRAGQWEWVIE